MAPLGTLNIKQASRRHSHLFGRNTHGRKNYFPILWVGGVSPRVPKYNKRQQEQYLVDDEQKKKHGGREKSGRCSSQRWGMVG